jgi:hypothetical protein
MWIGSNHPEPPYILLGQLCTAFYFSYFVVLVPLLGLIENTLSDLGTHHTSKNSPTRFYLIHCLTLPLPWFLGLLFPPFCRTSSLAESLWLMEFRPGGKEDQGT